MINPLEYTYKEGDRVEIDGWLLHALMQFTQQVEEDNLSIGLAHAYTAKPKEIKTKDEASGKEIVTHIDVEHKEYPSMNSFMSQQPVKFTSMLGAVAIDLRNNMFREHMKNIEAGKAIKTGTVSTPKESNEESPLKLA